MTDAYIGAETGVLKGIDFSKNAFQNFNPVASLDRTQEISRMCRISTRNLPIVKENDGDQMADESILCALVNRQLKLFDPKTCSYTNLFSCEGGRGAIKGLEELESGKIATCVESGEVSVWNMDGYSRNTTINAGDNICRMRRNPSKPNILATGGRENPLKLWDLQSAHQPTFMVKNVKHDWLDLRVPIWETDFRFAWDNECVITCTGHHHIRLYDPRGTQRRPVIQIEWGECPFTSISLTSRENQVVAGNSQGNMGLFDLRGKGKSKLVHCYRGFAGSVSSIECHPSEPYVASCGMDRFARLHNVFSKEQLNKIYCKSRLNCLLLNDDLTISRGRKDDDESDDGEKAYHSDEGNPEDKDADDDVMWNDMKKVDDKKKRRNRNSSASNSEGDASDRSDSQKRVKTKKKKRRETLAVDKQVKRELSPSQSSKVRKRMKSLKMPSDVDEADKSGRRKRKVGSDSPAIVRKIKVRQGAG